MVASWCALGRNLAIVLEDTMGRSAIEKLREATEIDKQADKLRKRDASSAAALDGLARQKRASAIRQMKRRPKRRAVSRV